MSFALIASFLELGVRSTGHDDVANAAAGVVDVLTASKSGYYNSMQWVSGPYDAEDDDGPPMIRTPRGTGRADSRH